jgi:ADP-ribose pyrophosphatase YjhB (NUDIX family)
MAERTPAERIALWADRMRDISALGLRYANNIYDKEHFRAIQDIALEMFALASGEPLEAVEPLRDTLFARPTPLAVGDGAVINERGEILLIRRADNRLWAMPGGGFMVGETPAEGAVREVFEETGVRCEPVALVGVHDSRGLPAAFRQQLYMFLFLCRPLAGGHVATPSHDNETLEMGWFAEEELPADLDPRHVTRIPEAFRVWRGDGRAYFDV